MRRTTPRRDRLWALAGIVAALVGCDTIDSSAPPGPAGATTFAAAPFRGDADPAAYRERVFYQLWVRAFADSDNDGIGDLRGATARLGDLARLGIGGIWLGPPTFPSPLADSGYDVADYRGVHPDYGSLSDLGDFVAAAHELGLLVYLDMVFNHTSDQHEWFQSALTGPASPYFDYFVWASAPATHCADIPPITPFGTQRWTYADSADAWFFHQFFPRQPDLNFRNPAVQEELLDILRTWMDFGIDGFRFDVPHQYFEDGNLCTHRPDTYAFHRRLRETISGGVGTLARGFVGEVWGLADQIKSYLGPDRDPMVFNFELHWALVAGIALGESPDAIARQVDVMHADLPSESRWGIVLGNHDLPRFAELARDDAQRARLGAAVQMTLPGVPFVWMGEELGLTAGTETHVDWRDTARQPYPWEVTTPGLGFTGAATPFLRFSPDAERKAWRTQRHDPASVYRHYQALIHARNALPALHAGGYRDMLRQGPVWAYARTHAAGDVWVVHDFARRGAAVVSLGAGERRDWLTGATVNLEAVAMDAGQTRLLVAP